MAYTKPQVIAQNASSGSYAAGCPAKDNQDKGYNPTQRDCKFCERAK